MIKSLSSVVFRQLSERVRAEYAALYSDSSDDTSTSTATLPGPGMRLQFDK